MMNRARGRLANCDRAEVTLPIVREKGVGCRGKGAACARKLLTGLGVLVRYAEELLASASACAMRSSIVDWEPSIFCAGASRQEGTRKRPQAKGAERRRQNGAVAGSVRVHGDKRKSEKTSPGSEGELRK